LQSQPTSAEHGPAARIALAAILLLAALWLVLSWDRHYTISPDGVS
jgi:hypothetical protein